MFHFCYIFYGFIVFGCKITNFLIITAEYLYQISIEMLQYEDFYFLYYHIYYIANNKNELPINDQIKVAELMVIGPNGEQMGLKKLEDELQDLKVVKRKEVAQKIKEAREQGDLSENAEYDAAKDEQRDIEARIEQIEKILKNAEVVVEEEVDLDKINIGCKVKILDIEYNEELEYKIVGSTEANSLKGKISNESPLGHALLGASVGDEVVVEAPAGEISYKVLSIQRSN